MRNMAFAILALATTVAVWAQQEPVPPRVGVGATTFSDVSNLPVARIGDNDLIGVTVYDAPELTRTVRVSSEGDILLPMVKQPIHAAGLYPEELEKAIAGALIRDHVLVDPVVTVSIVEYQSRPITVAGAVRMPLTFQAWQKTSKPAIVSAGGSEQSHAAASGRKSGQRAWTAAASRKAAC